VLVDGAFDGNQQSWRMEIASPSTGGFIFYAGVTRLRFHERTN